MKTAIQLILYAIILTEQVLNPTTSGSGYSVQQKENIWCKKLVMT